MSDKDVLGLEDDAKRQKNLLYLSLCSDLLGIIGVITGYYSQENPSLLYNRLTGSPPLMGILVVWVFRRREALGHGSV